MRGTLPIIAAVSDITRRRWPLDMSAGHDEAKRDPVHERNRALGSSTRDGAALCPESPVVMSCADRVAWSDAVAKFAGVRSSSSAVITTNLTIPCDGSLAPRGRVSPRGRMGEFIDAPA